MSITADAGPPEKMAGHGGDNYETPAEERFGLREQRRQLEAEQVETSKTKKRIEKRRAEMVEDRDRTLGYSEKLVRKFVKRVDILPDRIRVTPENGDAVDVKI